LLRGVDGREQLAVYDDNRGVETHDGIEVFLFTQIDEALRAGFFRLMALRGSRGEIALKKGENIGVSFFYRLGSEHKSSPDLMEAQRYMGPASLQEREIIILVLVAKYILCAGAHTTGSNPARRVRDLLQFVRGDPGGMRTICRGASPQVSMAAWQYAAS
jgi:hypothetical protein